MQTALEVFGYTYVNAMYWGSAAVVILTVAYFRQGQGSLFGDYIDEDLEDEQWEQKDV